jgi:hypothetical protein
MNKMITFFINAKSRKHLLKQLRRVLVRDSPSLKNEMSVTVQVREVVSKGSKQPSLIPSKRCTEIGLIEGTIYKE